MAQITKTVNKTLVQGSEIFIYTINVSYSGLTQPAQDGTLTDFFPSKIIYALPQIGGQIKGITQTPVAGGTNVTFDFGAVNAGTSLSFTVASSFGPGRVDNDSFTNVGLLFADGVQVATGTAPTVNLILTPNFQLSKTLVPAGPVNPNQVVTFYLDLTNTGDLGAAINNVVITDILPPQLIPVTTVLPTGSDVPSDGYFDSTYNGLMGSWNGSTLNFTLPSYHGADYRIRFQATVAANVTPGEIITNTATWTANNIPGNNAVANIVVFSPSDQFNFLKQGPRSGLVGSPVTYTLSSSNIGTTPLTNYVIDDPLPPEIDIHQLQFTSNIAAIPSYSIFIATSDNPGALKPIVQNVSGNTALIDLMPFIPAGARVTEVQLTAPTLNALNSGHVLSLFGTVNNTAVIGEAVVNTATVSATGVQATSSWEIDITGSSDLNVTKGILPVQPAYYPLEDFQFVLTAKPLNTITVDPIFADLLPNGVFYVVGSEYFSYTSAETGISYDSRQPNFPVPLPTREIIDNFGGTGRTLVRWTFDYIQPQNDTLTIYFTCFVEINPASSFTNNVYLGNPGDNVAFVYNAVPDTLDYDGDGITNENLSAAEVTGVILTTSEFLLQKQVKGALDLAFSNFGTTTEGGNITYNLTVTNNQVTQITNINIVDILPYVGDTGVILTNVPRGSQFNVYATSSVTAQIVNLIGNPVDPNPDITILYSTSRDPMRFDQFGNPIGTGTWSTTPPTNITTLAAIQILTGPEVILNSYDQLIITINAVAPVGVPVGEIAYNSFAVMADQIINGQVESLLPTEPNKVGVTIAAAQNGSIGDFVWADQNGNGIFDPGEPGVNGITVQLYDANQNLLATTVTANNASNQPGYYLFNNLPAGNYFVKFIPYGNYTLTKQEAGVPNGSTPNPATGFTNVIALAANQQITTVNAGVLIPSCPPPVINARNQCVFVGTVFNPLTDVTATDCDGNNITSDIIVTENTVNTSVVGVYSVTYSVTDSNNQTTIKTISVVVCVPSPYQQAISDVIESIALQQTALSHILNAEGEKIQAALAIPDITADELISINKSVQSMVNTIGCLEMVFCSKLGVFKCPSCAPGNCCSPLI